MSQPISCIYHKNCIDGTSAAAFVLRKFPHAQTIALTHAYTSEEMESVLNQTSLDTHVYIVDGTLGVHQFLKRGNQVTVIDHHTSESSHMEELALTHKAFTYVFKSTKSGASLTWTHLFPDESAPELLRYIEDFDLWKHEFGSVTPDVVRYLSLFNNKPKKMLERLMGSTEEVKIRGKIISEYADKSIERLLELPAVTLRIGSFSVPAFNITDHESVCGNILTKKLDTAVALFTMKGNSVKFGFRSLEHHEPSALMLAEIFGGGGNKNISGAEITFTEFLARVSVEKNALVSESDSFILDVLVQ